MKVWPRSLRGRITLAAVGVVGAVLTVAAIAIVVVQRDQLLENIDDSLDREAADIVVEMLPVTTPPTSRDLRDRRGVLEWAFEAAPGEARDIKLGWRVKWPKDKTVVLSPAG